MRLAEFTIPDFVNDPTGPSADRDRSDRSTREVGGRPGSGRLTATRLAARQATSTVKSEAAGLRRRPLYCDDSGLVGPSERAASGCSVAVRN